jgi:hypothetical protein
VADDEDFQRAASAVMGLLFEVYPAQLSREEIRRELADVGRIDVDDALERVARVGLAHSHGDFYWATRTALEGDDLRR